MLRGQLQEAYLGVHNREVSCLGGAHSAVRIAAGIIMCLLQGQLKGQGAVGQAVLGQPHEASPILPNRLYVKAGLTCTATDPAEAAVSGGMSGDCRGGFSFYAQHATHRGGLIGAACFLLPATIQDQGSR